jgi:hypothetical protein
MDWRELRSDSIRQRTDLARLRRCMLSQLAYFLRHDRETATLLASSRRFDRGIQRQEVRLLGYRGDDFAHLRDLRHVREQHLQPLRRFSQVHLECDHFLLSLLARAQTARGLLIDGLRSCRRVPCRSGHLLHASVYLPQRMRHCVSLLARLVDRLGYCLDAQRAPRHPDRRPAHRCLEGTQRRFEITRQHLERTRHSANRRIVLLQDDRTTERGDSLLEERSQPFQEPVPRVAGTFFALVHVSCSRVPGSLRYHRDTPSRATGIAVLLRNIGSDSSHREGHRVIGGVASGDLSCSRCCWMGCAVCRYRLAARTPVRGARSIPCHATGLVPSSGQHGTRSRGRAG